MNRRVNGRHVWLVAPWRDGQSLSRNEQNRLLEEADAVLVRLFTIDHNDLQRAGRLRVIAKHGVGVDNIDVAAATSLHVPVVFTPTANASFSSSAMTCSLTYFDWSRTSPMLCPEEKSVEPV